MSGCVCGWVCEWVCVCVGVWVGVPHPHTPTPPHPPRVLHGSQEWGGKGLGRLKMVPKSVVGMVWEGKK